MARKRPAPYVPLSVYYADDEAVMDAGEDAELMYLRMLAYAGRTPMTEGYVPRRVCLTRLGIALRPEVGPETAPETRLERLVEVELIAAEKDGYRLVSWLKWNRSIEEMGRERAQDRNRKASATRDYPEPGPENDPEDGPEPGPESTPDSRGQKQKQKQSKKNPSSSVADAPSDTNREDVENLCRLLADRIEENGSKRPTVSDSWRRQCRLMLDTDKRTEEQVKAAIEWCQSDQFWRGNILSMPTLRQKYDQLRLSALRKADEQKQERKLKPVPISPPERALPVSVA